MNDAPDFSKRVKQYRQLYSMTQEEFAAELGVEPLHISNIERGAKGMSLNMMMLMCQRFNINIADLLPTGEDDDSLKDKWIDEINEALRKMDAFQVSLLKRMICSMKN